MHPNHFSPLGGTPLNVYYRTEMLAELGHEVDLLTYPINQDVKIKNVHIRRSSRIPFIYNVKIGPSIKKLMLDIPRFLKAIRLILKSKYDVVHAHEEAAFFCPLFNLIFKVKYIYDKLYKISIHFNHSDRSKKVNTRKDPKDPNYSNQPNQPIT